MEGLNKAPLVELVSPFEDDDYIEPPPPRAENSATNVSAYNGPIHQTSQNPNANAQTPLHTYFIPPPDPNVFRNIFEYLATGQLTNGQNIGLPPPPQTRPPLIRHQFPQPAHQTVPAPTGWMPMPSQRTIPHPRHRYPTPQMLRRTIPPWEPLTPSEIAAIAAGEVAAASEAAARAHGIHHNSAGIPGPLVPKPPPPSEDEMAKQDLDADAQQDEEMHEIETYSDYIPSKLTIGLPHPDPVVETSSLSTVQPPDITYKLKLPSKVIDKGLLSALQLESVIYACQQHNQFLADGYHRRGFLIGDGAGVGKGRTIAGIIYENHLCGRKKSLWFSVSTDLKLDAERDLYDIGANISVNLLSKFPYGKKISISSGVLFGTYSGLVSKSQSIRGPLGSRMGQIVSWLGADFDGVIVFDECHKAKNLGTGKQKAAQSKAAQCALEIQERLPKARVVYASATGASETKHLGYMTRLGIWGLGTPYLNFNDFCSAIERRGVGAMELVAVDLKMRGSYIARQLSFKTSCFSIQIANLDADFVKIYDRCVDMWTQAFRSFSLVSLWFAGEKHHTKSLWSSFWAAHQKFFKYLCIGAKVPLVVEIAKQALLDGKCVVIGLQSTGEAKTLEALENGDVNEFISTARATFESLVENFLPVPKHARINRIAGTNRPPSTASTSSDEFLGRIYRAAAAANTDCHDSTSSGSSNTVVDESYVEGKDVKHSIANGVSAKTNGASTSQGTSSQSDKRKALKDLLKDKRAKEKASAKTSRAVRCQRRALRRDSARKSRVRMAHESSDSDFSNPLSPLLESSSSSRSNGGKKSKNKSDDADDSDETYRGSESESSTESSMESETEIDEDVPVKKARSNSDRGDESGENSDSDCQIMAVRPRQKNYEVIILDSDESEEELNSNLNPNNIQRSAMEIYGPRLIQMKEELFKLLDTIAPELPNNTLDDLIDRLGGPTRVAEMTGRKGRIEKDRRGVVSYKKRNEDDCYEDLNILEKERFMSGEKLIAIISEAASSGISLQADKRVENTRRRVHITLELPWSADRAIQQFGRTHRSNQTSGPEYIFVISELSGERRFASVVARRLENLGALTHGDRRATTETRDLSQFNIASRYCKHALDFLCRYVQSNQKFADIEPDYPKSSFITDARQAFLDTGLARQQGNVFCVEPQATQVNHFLNRLLGMKVRIQNALFKLFTDIMERLITRKKVAGQYETGIIELNADPRKTRIDPPEDFSIRTQSGIVKCYLHKVKVERGLSWEEAMEIKKNCVDSRSGFFTSTNPLTKAKMICLLVREPDSVDLFRSFKPNTGRSPKPELYSLIRQKCDPCSLAMAEKIWKMIYYQTDKQCIHKCFFNSCKRLEANFKCDVGLRHRNYCILSGGTLTAWPYLERKVPEVTGKLQIVRLKIDANNRVLGPIIHQDWVDRVRTLLKQAEQGVEF